MTEETGRPARDIESAIRCLQDEIVKNFFAKSHNGEPLAIHYITVIDALRELLARRQSDTPAPPAP